MNEFMAEAIKEAYKGIRLNHGGPFGSVIVKDGKIIGKGHNMVLKNNNATCHGEIMAIATASKKLKTYDLSNTIIYTTGEPCPMCLCACMWANISKVYYGATIKDNELIGFRDQKFDDLMGGRKNITNYLEMLDRKECLDLFNKYKSLNSKKY